VAQLVHLPQFPLVAILYEELYRYLVLFGVVPAMFLATSLPLRAYFLMQMHRWPCSTNVAEQVLDGSAGSDCLVVQADYRVPANGVSLGRRSALELFKHNLLH
jgi:hypothetical protein